MLPRQAESPLDKTRSAVLGKKDKESDGGQRMAIGLCLGIIFGVIYDNPALVLLWGCH
ncbi:MAG: hypothetical protein ACM3UW_09015 [Bacillota bacterium]